MNAEFGHLAAPTGPPESARIEYLPKAQITSWRNPVAWEVEIVIRRPFYLDLRLGTVQQALWFGRAGRAHRMHALFNRILDKPRYPVERAA